MSAFLIRLLLPVLVLALSATAARAADVAHHELADPVPGAESITYLDMARLVLPDLELRDGAYRGGEVVAMRHVDGTDFAAVPQGEFTVRGVAALPVRADGRDRMVLLLDLGDSVYSAEGFVVLALYEPGVPPVLLDAVQIGFDRSTHFRDPASIALNAGSDLVLTASTHFNSGQGYATSAMILVREGRFELVDTVSTFDDRGCGFERRQMPDFSIVSANGRTYGDIAVAVVETTSHTGEDCGGRDLPPAGTRTIAVTYRWDDARSRFVPDSDALEVLARENASRF